MSFEVAHYQDQLLTTSEQLDVLRGYNQRYWNGHFSEDDLAALEVTDTSPKLANVPVIHAEFGSSWKTFDAWRQVYLSSDITHLNTLPSDEEDFNIYVRKHAQTARYTPGLRIVHMDLTRDERIYPTMNEAYVAAETSNLLLAHSEALALVGLHRVFRESRGYAREMCPYLPGYQARDVFMGETWAGDYDHTLRFEINNSDRGGIRVFPTKHNERISGAVLFVHGNTDSQRTT